MMPKKVLVVVFCSMLNLGCSGGAMSSKALLASDPFPQEAEGAWRIGVNPKHSPQLPGGYVWAIYNPVDRETTGYGTLAVWIVHKGSPGAADDWLEKLLDDSHTPSSIEPLRLDHSEVQTMREIHEEITECPTLIRGNQAYERAKRLGQGNLNYRVYYADGQFVIGAECISGMRDAETIRSSILPVFEGLRLLQ